MGRTACTEPQCLYKGALYLYLFFTNQNEGNTFLPNVGNYSPNGFASHPRRKDSWKTSHSQLYLQTPGNTKAGEDSGGSVGNLFRFWTATNHGTAGVTGKFTPDYTSAVLQVKTSYQSEKLFRDDVLSMPRSNDRSICMILTPCLLYRTKAMREGHTSCWSWRCTIDTRVFVSISTDRQPTPPRRAGYRRQVKVTRSIWRADKLVDKCSNQIWKTCTKPCRTNADFQT